MLTIDDAVDTWRDLHALQVQLHAFTMLVDGPEIAAVTAGAAP
ncbi:hypothetical protein [Haloechinothrix sp. LS1_15]|nr:hypothetical protein [Haloechinothrix sp. LS1_15]